MVPLAIMLAVAGAMAAVDGVLWSPIVAEWRTHPPPWYKSFPVPVDMGAGPDDLAAAFLLFFTEEMATIPRAANPRLNLPSDKGVGPQDLAWAMTERPALGPYYAAFLGRVVADWNASDKTEASYVRIRMTHSAEATRILMSSNFMAYRFDLVPPAPSREEMLKGLVVINSYHPVAPDNGARRVRTDRFPRAARVSNVKQLLTAIAAALGRPATRWIVVEGHGSPGTIEAGLETLTAASLMANAGELVSARGKGAGVSLILHGCRTGSDPNLVIALSRLLPLVTICAGNRAQYAQSDGFRGSYRRCQNGVCTTLDAGPSDFILFLLEDWKKDAADGVDWSTYGIGP